MKSQLKVNRKKDRAFNNKQQRELLIQVGKHNRRYSENAPKAKVALIASEGVEEELKVVDNQAGIIYQGNALTEEQSRSKSSSPYHPQGVDAISFLPPIESNKKTLVLDLDETLVHSSFIPYSYPADIILEVELEGAVHSIYVLVRPGTNEFLEVMAERYELVIFTASLSKYADPLLDILDRKQLCSFRLFREHCTVANANFTKDLDRLGRDMKDVILVDNFPCSFALHRSNGLPILSWYEDKDDKELFKLMPVLIELSTVNDVRECINRIVLKDDAISPQALEIITNYKQSVRNAQSLMDDYHSEVVAAAHSPIKVNEDDQQEITIRIVNNDFANNIYLEDEEKVNDREEDGDPRRLHTLSNFGRTHQMKNGKNINSFRRGKLKSQGRHQENTVRHKKKPTIDSKNNELHANQLNRPSKKLQLLMTGVAFLESSKQNSNGHSLHGIKSIAHYRNHSVAIAKLQSNRQQTSTEESESKKKRLITHTKSRSFNFASMPSPTSLFQKPARKKMKELKIDITTLITTSSTRQSKTPSSSQSKRASRCLTSKSSAFTCNREVNSILKFYTNKVSKH